MASLNLLWLAHDRSELVETVTNFEGETSENRLARRHRNWTPEAADCRN